MIDALSVEVVLLIASESCEAIVVDEGAEADFAVSVLDVDLGVEGGAAEGAGDDCTAMRLHQPVAIPILLVMHIRVEVNARN